MSPPETLLNQVGLKHEALTEKIIKAFYSVYNELGHGFLEAVYEEAMAISLREAGFNVARQYPVAVWFHQHKAGEFKADLVVENLVLVELKAVQSLDASHHAQIINYLNATEFEVGLLLNFGPKPEIQRRMLDNDRKKALPLCAKAQASV